MIERMKIDSSKKWLLLALANFFTAAILGALMRLAFVEELTWMKFRNVLHGHSHVAMLGWLYLILMILIVRRVLGPDAFRRRNIQLNLWITQVSVWGMLIAFPIQGYGPAAILFSTVHVLASYHLGSILWKGLRSTSNIARLPAWVLKSSLFFMFLSTVGLWVMPPIIIMEMQGSLLYIMAVQFYLHFQLNGWFIFAAIGLLLDYWVQRKTISFNRNLAFRGMKWLAFATVITYALALSWASPVPALFALNGAGVLIQFIALLFLFTAFNQQLSTLTRQESFHGKWLLRIGLLTFAMKIFMQSAVVIPVIAQASYTIRNLVIGFLHLILLGVVSHLALFIAQKEGLIRINRGLSGWGGILLGAGFILSEAVLFIQGCLFWGAMGFLPGYYELLLGVSLLIPIGILLLIAGQYEGKPTDSPYATSPPQSGNP